MFLFEICLHAIADLHISIGLIKLFSAGKVFLENFEILNFIFEASHPLGMEFGLESRHLKVITMNNIRI